MPPTEAVRRRVLARAQGQCEYCRIRGWPLTVDHVVPRWDDLFAWAEDYTVAVGLTPVGRATVAQLRLNRAVYRHQRRLLRAAMRGGDAPLP